jgi:putative GTP pyrophosphokinase
MARDGKGRVIMEESGIGGEEFSRLMLGYRSALKTVQTKIEILNDDFITVHHYNPIEHVKYRIKKKDSIIRKLKKNGHEITIENMVRYVNDIAGIRIICSFVSDIYRLADVITGQSDLEVLTVKNYLISPKDNGYTSYHMILSVPVYLSDGERHVKVEVQIRTIAMDFWASLDHKIRYKFEGQTPDYIGVQLKNCADIVASLDRKMEQLNRDIQGIAREQTVSVEEQSEKQQHDSEALRRSVIENGSDGWQQYFAEGLLPDDGWRQDGPKDADEIMDPAPSVKTWPEDSVDDLFPDEEENADPDSGGKNAADTGGEKPSEPEKPGR